MTNILRQTKDHVAKQRLKDDVDELYKWYEKMKHFERIQCVFQRLFYLTSLF